MVFVLAHLSDPHLGPMPRPSPGELFGKRMLGYVNWRLRRAVAWDPLRLQRVVSAVHKLAPDHIVVTGDLVNIALPAEIARAAEWLRSLGGPDKVSVVPGNHDAYVPGAEVHLARHWGTFMRGDANTAGVDGAFPFVRRFGDVALVGLSTAEPTPPFMATGGIGPHQAERAGALLSELGAAGLFRIVLIHHPPGAAATTWHRRLRDNDRFERLAEGAGAELVLHGHNHCASVRTLDTQKNGSLPLVGATSASGLYRHGIDGEAGFNLIHVERQATGFACRLTQYALSGERVSPLREIALRPASTP